MSKNRSMSSEGPGFWIKNRLILRLADRLSKQTGENIDEAVLLALQDWLEREDRFDPGIRRIVRPEFVAAARRIASSLRSGRTDTNIVELVRLLAADDALDGIEESSELELRIAELGLRPEDDQELIELCAWLEECARHECLSTRRLFLALVQAYVQSASIPVRRTRGPLRRTSHTLSHQKLLIPYQSEKFPNRCPCSSKTLGHELPVTWDDILWAALTVGRPSLSHVFRHGTSSVHEALFRLSLVRMAIQQEDGDQRLHPTKAFKALDPTEKGAVSYFLGMVVCKIFADKCLSTPWVLHIDVFGDQWKVRVNTGRSRPDLFGERTGSKDWHVFESKGRSRSISRSDKDKAKRQTGQVMRINGVVPKLRIGAFSYFKQNALHFYWCDPEPNGPDEDSPIDLRLPRNAWGEHYRLATEVMLAAGTLGRYWEEEGLRDVPLAEIPALDVAVGAHPAVRRHLFESQFDAAREAAHGIQSGADALALPSDEAYRPDGLVVQSGTSWGEPRESSNNPRR